MSIADFRRCFHDEVFTLHWLNCKNQPKQKLYKWIQSRCSMHSRMKKDWRLLHSWLSIGSKALRLHNLQSKHRHENVISIGKLLVKIISMENRFFLEENLVREFSKWDFFRLDVFAAFTSELLIMFSALFAVFYAIKSEHNATIKKAW